MSLVLILGQHFESALAVAKDGPRDVDQLQALALAYSALGHTEQADRMLAELLDPTTAADPIQIAEVYAYRGQPDLAFEWLHAAIEREVSEIDPPNANSGAGSSDASRRAPPASAMAP